MFLVRLSDKRWIADAFDMMPVRMSKFSCVD